MKPDQYRQVREHLGHSNYAFRRLLGVSLRQAQRYESGETRVPPVVQRLLFMFARFGVPAELQGQLVGRGVGNRRVSGLRRAKRNRE